MLKTCLYDAGVLNMRDLMRSGCSDEHIRQKLLLAFAHRPKNGFEAEQQRNGIIPVHESMATIGG
jgi:cyclic pyranopterin phosphate synthase